MLKGFETEVISGARRILEKPDLRCVLIELAGYGKRYGFDENVLRHQMAELGFESCPYDPFARSLQRGPIRGGNKNHTENTLFVRDIEFVQQRVEGAPCFHCQRLEDLRTAPRSSTTENVPFGL